jgi:hypothetical protein
MEKGKNGQQIANESVMALDAWIKERNAQRDYLTYKIKGKYKLNRTQIAEELDFAKSACYQNSRIKKRLEDSESLWYGKTEPGTSNVNASQQAADERAVTRSVQIVSQKNTLENRVAELEVENQELRNKLRKIDQLQALVENGATGFKV